MSSSSSPESTRQCAPFSVQEFGNLVAIALELESDRFSEVLQFTFDPDQVSSSFSLPSTPSRSPLSWFSNMSNSVRQSHWSLPDSRRRQFFDKIKRSASAAAVALRPAISPLVITPQPNPTPAPPYKSPAAAISRHSSFFDDSDDDEEDPFTPYIPIASRYERAIRAEDNRASTPKPSTPPGPSHSGLSIFSRPSSSITRPTAASPPPSPTSVRSVSSASSTSTATEHSTPRTPTTPRHSPTDAPSTPKSSDSNRWSFCTDESAHPYGYTYTQHPFAQQPIDDDPFAKGSVQVIHRSKQKEHQSQTSRHHSLPASPSSSYSSSPSRSRSVRSIPPRPPPSGPLPQPPSHYGSDTEASSEDLHAQEPSDTEWTLHLGVGAPLSIKQKHSSAPIAPKWREPDWTLFLPLDVAYPGNAGRVASTTPTTLVAPDASSVAVADTLSSCASSILSATTVSSTLSTPTLFSHFPSPPSSLPHPLPVGLTSPPRVNAPHLRAYPHPRRFVLSAPSRSPYVGPNAAAAATTTSSRAVLFQTPTSSTRVLRVRRPACSMVGGSTSDSARAVASGRGLAALELKRSKSCRAMAKDRLTIRVEMYDEDEGEDDMDPDAEADSIYYSARSSFSI